MPPPKQPAADLTMAELAAVLAHALGTDYEGVRSKRVRHLPDARTIRWYQTLGIVDRPAAFRGRTALFARRHILQLAAIKRLQAAGHPLTDIQRGLAGKTDAELARAAGVSLTDVERCVANAVEARARTKSQALRAAVQAKPSARRSAAAFWKSRPADPMVDSSAPPVPPAAAALQSISLGGTAALLWSGRPLTSSERDAVARLARPAIEFLASRAAGDAAEPAGGAVSSSARTHDPREKEAHP